MPIWLAAAICFVVAVVLGILVARWAITKAYNYWLHRGGE